VLRLHDDAVIGVDQIVGRITKEMQGFRGLSPLTCRIRMGVNWVPPQMLRECRIVQGSRYSFSQPWRQRLDQMALANPQSSFGVEFLLVGNQASIRLASAQALPLTKHLRCTRDTLLEQMPQQFAPEAPCRFLENVNGLATGSDRSRTTEPSDRRFKCTSSHNRPL